MGLDSELLGNGMVGGLEGRHLKPNNFLLQGLTVVRHSVTLG